MSIVSLYLHRVWPFFSRAFSRPSLFRAVGSEGLHLLSRLTLWEYSSLLCTFTVACLAGKGIAHSTMVDSYSSLPGPAAVWASISIIRGLSYESLSRTRRKVLPPNSDATSATSQGAHAGTLAMSRAYVRRLPKMASTKESSRSNVCRFTLPSFSLNANSSTYRARCLGEA